MATEVKTFNSLSEFMKFIDSKLAEYRRMLGELLRVLEDVRARADQDRKLRSLLQKLGVAQTQTQPPTADLHGVKVAFNPPAEVELEMLEQLVESVNDKITKLQTLKKDLEAIAAEDIEAQVKAVIIDDIPRSLMIKL